MPYNCTQCKHEQIKESFNTIAHKYDQLNRILAWGLDLSWRKRALRWLSHTSTAPCVLDAATGTADFAILTARYLPHAHITGIDFSENMLRIGKAKIAREKLSHRIKLLQGDCLALPLPDACFDIATLAFGMRNFENITRGLAELRRILKPSGMILILELSQPQYQPMRSFYGFYQQQVIPCLGRILTGHAREYRYLADSIQSMPQPATVLQLLHEAGFTGCHTRSYTAGICSCYIGNCNSNCRVTEQAR